MTTSSNLGGDDDDDDTDDSKLYDLSQGRESSGRKVESTHPDDSDDPRYGRSEPAPRKWMGEKEARRRRKERKEKSKPLPRPSGWHSSGQTRGNLKEDVREFAETHIEEHDINSYNKIADDPHRMSRLKRDAEEFFGEDHPHDPDELAALIEHLA